MNGANALDLSAACNSLLYMVEVPRQVETDYCSRSIVITTNMAQGDD